MARKNRAHKSELRVLNSMLKSLMIGVDHRTTVAKLLKEKERGYVEHLGGVLSATQARLVREIAIHEIACESFENFFLVAMSRGEMLPPEFNDFYSPWVSRLFVRLKTLGWKQPQRPPIKLNDYLDQKDKET